MIMKRYFALQIKSLGGCRWLWSPGLGTDSIGLGFGICTLTASCLMAKPIRSHDLCKILTGRPNWCLLARERFLLV